MNKPSGIPSVPHSPVETETAVGSALAHCPSLALVGRAGLEPGLLHRLDTETSGLLAFAKTNKSYEWLKFAWKSGAVKKVYRAISSSPKHKPRPRAPQILSPILAHVAKSSKRMMVWNENENHKPLIRGKPLSTKTHLMSVASTNKNQIDLTLEIKTGIMHQIRCTLAHLGWPVLGDPIYRGDSSTRLWLHAWKLEFPTLDHPDGIKVEAPLPLDWPGNLS